MLTSPSPALYLKAGRLADVLALVQVLAYGEFAKRTDDGLIKQLRRAPVTAPTWTELGMQHPELFRVLEAEKHSSGQQTVALIARFLQQGIESQSDEPPKSPPLTADVTSKLMELAIHLHDREVQRKDWWKSVVVPIAVALITAVATIVGVLIGSAKGAEPPKTTEIGSAYVRDSHGISNGTRSNL